MSRVGVIINPRSRQGRSKGLSLAAKLPAGIDVVILDEFSYLHPSLERLAGAGVTDLFISSGDGTLHAIQTWLAESGHLKPPPRLCILPHGTTNMTAADLGFQRKSLDEQAMFIADPKPRTLLARHTLRVINAKGRGPMHGMFFGTGAVTEAARYCQRVFNDRGLAGNAATLATLATVIGRNLLLRSSHAKPDWLDRPYPISLKADGKLIVDGQNVMMIATTLEKLILGSRPFWGGATAPLRTTTLPHPIPNVTRWLWPVMFGTENRKAPPGATSTACLFCEVTSPTSFIIDGEFYDPPTDEPLRLETGPKMEYIVA